ncbi:MAG: GAF domain-containing protein [Myxococcota bacterium]
MGSNRRDEDLGWTHPLAERTARLARLLLEIDPADLAASVDQAVAEVGSMAEVDRCVLVLNARDDSGGLTRFEWSVPGLRSFSEFPEGESLSRYRWATDRLQRREPICIARVDDLPEEAKVEAQTMRESGIVSALTLPIWRGDRTLGFMVLQRYQPRRPWTDSDIHWLQLASDLLVNAIERSRAERALADQLSIEHRIAALSQRILELSSDRLEDGIGLSLEFVLDTSDADRARLVAIEPRPPFVRQVWEQSRPGVAGVGTEMGPVSPDRFAWSTRQIRAGRVLKVRGPDDLPPEAAAEREDHIARGVLSQICIPVHSEGSLVGCLTVEYLREAHSWDDSEVNRLRLVADILASARRRQRAESDLARQLAAEQAIASLSRRFMALSPGEIEDAVKDGLREAATLAQGERALLVFFDRVNAQSRTHEWRAPGVPPVPHHSRGRRWALEKVLRGETLRFEDVQQIPDEARSMREMLVERGVMSLLGLPVFFGDQLVGYIGFESIREQRWWTDQEITLLRLVGELLASALQRRATEQALQESQVQLIQSQKMEAVGRLAGGIAHDFNNLLTVILGFSRAVMGELEADHWAREDVGEIHAAAERAAGLTKQLLTFSRQQRTQSQAVELGGAIRGLEEMLRRLLGEDVDLQTAIPEGDWWVKGDPHQIEQVLINLAVNARDAMPDGGSLTIDVHARSVDEGDRRRLGLRGAGPHVVLSVSDTGVGLDEELREQIFEPFFTTKEPGKGTGLGLSIVYSVVEQAGGSISVHGGLNKGTVFEILLPVLEEEAAAEETTRDPMEPRRGGTILLVEDEQAVRKLARRILERDGYRVLEARDGVEALETARQTADPIDLLITDVVMPRMGGGELVRQLQLDRPATPVLFVSGYPQDRSEGLVETPHGARFLYKPFSAGQLVDEIQVCLRSSEDD